MIVMFCDKLVVGLVFEMQASLSQTVGTSLLSLITFAL